MKLTRRKFLTTSTAASLTAALPARGATRFSELVAMPARQQIAPDRYPQTDIWSFGGTMPGQTLRYKQGDRLQLSLRNNLPEPTTVHWHGIRIENAMDGVPGLTQDPIAPGAVFDYDFTLPDAGTYWYHSHAQTVKQMERGLYGALVVEEKDAPDIDGDEVFVLDDIRMLPDATIADDFNAFHDLSHAGRIGNVILTNGQTALRKKARRGDRLRLRLINAANARIFDLALQGLKGWIMALDGMPLATPRPVEGVLNLAPSQRIDLFVDVIAEESEAFLLHIDRDGGYAQVTYNVSPGSDPRPNSPAPLPANPHYPVTLAGAHSVQLRIEGGAMGGMSHAVWQGERQNMRDLARQGMFWALNGQVGRTDVPLADLSLGESVQIGMFNDTAFPHAMHLHGMHFHEVIADGTLGPLRDTVLIGRNEAKIIAFNAHNPGDWLFHCHMLSHHAAGMGSWIKVRA